MREKLKWADVSYSVEKDNGKSRDFEHESCFGYIRDYGSKSKLLTITLFDINCKVTMEYRDFYLQYITDMLGLESEILENGFKFKASHINHKNLLVLSLLRFLFENIGHMTPALDIVKFFLKPLRDDNCEYTDKLERYCHFYSLIPQDNYWHDGHCWKPKNTAIKSTKDYLECNELYNVNSFFEKKEKYE
jgi:hypothetical protein